MRAALLTCLVLLALPAAASASGTLVTFKGGYVVPNGNYKMTVGTSGTAKVQLGSRIRRVQLSATELTGIRRRIAKAHFSRLATRYRFDRSHGPPIVGVQNDVVTYRRKTVTVEPGANVPVALNSLLRYLQAVFDRHRPGA